MQTLRFTYTPEGDGRFEFEICTDNDEKIDSHEVNMLREAMVGFFVTLRTIQLGSEISQGTDADKSDESFVGWLKKNGIK